MAVFIQCQMVNIFSALKQIEISTYTEVNTSPFDIKKVTESLLKENLMALIYMSFEHRFKVRVCFFMVFIS